MAHWKQWWMSHPMGRTRVDCRTQDTPFTPLPSSRDVPSLRPLDDAANRPIKLLSVAPCPSHIPGGTATPHHNTSLVGGGPPPPFHANMGVVQPHPKCICTTILPCPQPPQQAPAMSYHMSMSWPTSTLFLVIPDEGSMATMMDTGHPTITMNCMVLHMTVPSVAQVLAPAPLAPATMLPPLNETQGVCKWLLEVQAILHAKCWNGITTQNTESLAYE
jgi:hypothetical protein